MVAPVSLDRRMLAAHSLVTSASRLSLHCGVGRADGHNARVLVPRPPACDTERTRKINVFAVRNDQRRYQAPGVIHDIAEITGQQGFTAVVAHLAPVIVRANVRASVAPNFLGLVLQHRRSGAAPVRLAFAVKVLVQEASRDTLFTEGKRAREEGTHVLTDEIACALMFLNNRSRFAPRCHRFSPLTGASTPRMADDTVSRNVCGSNAVRATGGGKGTRRKLSTGANAHKGSRKSQNNNGYSCTRQLSK